MTIVDRSVETAGTALNEIYEGRTALSQAIKFCSDFGSGDWRDVTSTQMVEDMGERPLSNIATKHPELRCFSVVAALLNAKGIDVVGTRDDYTPLAAACSLDLRWPIVVHLLDMLKYVPNNGLNDTFSYRGYTAFQRAVQYSPGAVIALIKQPDLKPNLTGNGFPWKRLLEDMYTTQHEMVMAALRHVGAVLGDTVEANTQKRTVQEYLESNKITTPFQWPI
jgi:hypothetical protein